jgi:ubiquinone/menaquinone biosynthesis C-methylase UbiE
MAESSNYVALVGSQFGSSAEAYLKSPDHSTGPDLEALAALAGGFPAARVLDLGCGAGHASFTVAPHMREVVAYDLSPAMLAVVARAAAERGLGNIVTRQGVAEDLPFEDGSFDLVLSRLSAHHWRDLEAGLREAARVLKPCGSAIVIDAVAPGAPLLDTFLQTIELLRDCSHVRNYSRAEWEAAIARAGLITGNVSEHRRHLDFKGWIERMHTPKVQADAIRALQAAVSPEVIRYFATAPDGSFSIDIAMFEASKPVS